MYRTKRPIIFVSNPFGFGPTGVAVAILDKLSDRYTDKLIFAASSKCLGLVSKNLKKKIIIEKIDERNEKALSELFKTYKNPLVVVCLNKVAITIAKKLCLDAFFVDILTWLWNKIPKEYLKANIYYGFDIFDSHKKTESVKHAKLIPPVFGKPQKVTKRKKNLILIHIGGFTNPLVPGFSKTYLSMLAQSLNNLARDKPDTKLILAGGPEATTFIKGVLNKQVAAQTLPQNIFLKYMSQAKSFITTPGMTATLESFFLKTPISFLPPTNLSQWQQQKLFSKAGAVKDAIYWENYISNMPDFNRLTEKDAIPEFWRISNDVYNSKELRKNFIYDLYKLIGAKHFPQLEQEKFLADPRDGAKIIIDDILDLVT